MDFDKFSMNNTCPMPCEISTMDVSEEVSFGSEEDPLFLKPTSSVLSSSCLSHYRNKPGRPKNSIENYSVPPQSTVVANFLLEKHKSQAENDPMRQSDQTFNTINLSDSPWQLDSEIVMGEKFNHEYNTKSKNDIISGNLDSAAINVENKMDNIKLEYVNVSTSNHECNKLESETSEIEEKLYKLRSNSNPKAKKYICDQCGYRAKSGRNLRSHCRTHSIELPYICPLEGCKFTGKNPNSLKYHKRTVHPSGDPLQCGIVGCEFTTLFPPTLRMHNLKKHSGEKPIACELCSYRCFMNVELRKHMRTHSPLTPYACDYPGCGYACKIASNLRKHKRSHTDERPYACEQCAFRSNFISSLKAHRRTHTGEKPYCCHRCGYRCNSASNLKKHISQKHKLKCGPVCKNGGEMYVSTCLPDLRFGGWPQRDDEFKMENIEDG